MYTRSQGEVKETASQKHQASEAGRIPTRFKGLGHADTLIATLACRTETTHFCGFKLVVLG